MSGARDQVTRLLALVPYLQAREAVPLSEVAADFGVTPEQVRRDLQVLWMCGLPGFGPGELIDIDFEAIESDPDGLVRLDNAEYLSRPVRFDRVEASALIVALRALRETSGAEARAVIDRTLARLERVAGDAIEALTVPAVPPEAVRHRDELARAIAEDRQVRLDYYVPTRDETTQRRVDPVALLREGGISYLDGWCHLAGDRRTFRLSRIHGVAVLDSPREVRTLAPRARVFEPAPDAARATIRLAPYHRWFVEHHPVESVAETADGGLEVGLWVNDPRWLVRLALRLAPGLEIIEPVSLREHVQQTARSALALYAPA